MTDSEPRIKAKRAFVLADRLKGAPFENTEIFLSVLASERSRVESLSEVDLDSIISRDTKRLRDYNAAKWKLDQVTLHTCMVYPGMGERAWARGSVRDVAEKFKLLEPLASRIWTMKHFSSVFASQLPILVLNENGAFRIDDGSHRAVAMALSGVQTVMAWVGEL